jgi:hypothetical protein
MQDVAELTEQQLKDAEKLKKDLNNAFAWDWAYSNHIILPDGNFVMEGREYLWEPMTSHEQCEVTMKGTQGGFSMAETLTDIFGCIRGLFPKGVIYAMPTDTDVQSMSKTKWNPLIADNPNSIGKFIQSSGKGGTDSADLKKIGRSYIYFLTATLKKGDSGEKTSSTLKSRPCDKFICDEFDEMDPDVLEMLWGRYADSEIKQERIISNPLSESSGSHKLFMQSTQRYWNRLCPSCLKFFCPDEEFFNCPEKIITPDCKNGIILCKHCGKPTPMFCFDKKTKRVSGYQESYPGRKWVGRHWSHLNSVRSNAWDILQDYQNPPEGNLGDVMRNKLGRPYTSKEDQLRPSDVRSCCGVEPMSYSHPGPCIAGVDVMTVIHAVIGYRTSRDTFEIIKAATVKDFKELYDLFKRYGVKTAGIDVAPDLHAAKEFQKTVKALSCRAWLVDYKTSKNVGPYAYDDVNMIIKANRTEVMDMSHNVVVNKKLVLPRQEQCSELIKQICDPFKIQKNNDKTGIPEYRYVGSVDHFRHCVNYFLLAGQKATVVLSPGSKKTKIVSDYQRC